MERGVCNCLILIYYLRFIIYMIKELMRLLNVRR